MPWPDFLFRLKSEIEELIKFKFNFALVNRYQNGTDYMGEHRDNEPNLDPNSPIVSINLGENRSFVFRHKSLVRKNSKNKPISVSNITDCVELELKHGSLLIMYPPTNHYWYHSLPRKKKLKGVRINITLRNILKQ
ncbi:unnamed protein product [Gordionus sp. m RMFG-2023]